MSTAPMGPTELADKAGQEIGVSSWIEVGQQRIDEFAHLHRRPSMDPR